MTEPGSSSRARNKHNLLAMNYDRKFPYLKVVHKCRSYLATMGIPKGNGEHYLWPEEAVFLLEGCSAIIYKDGNPLTTLEAYRILYEKNVPQFKYIIYVTLKKAGFVVMRPNRKEIASKLHSAKPDTTSVEKSAHQLLLDSFPTLDKSDFFMPLRDTSKLLAPFAIDQMKPPDLSVLQITRSGNRLAPCRPKYMPYREDLVNAKNWKDFSTLKKSYSTRNKRLRGFASTSANKEKDMRICGEPDFELYPTTYSFHSSIEPTFKVICYDSSSNLLDIHSIREQHGTDDSVLVALYQHGKINFIRTSGQEIDLYSMYNTVKS